MDSEIKIKQVASNARLVFWDFDGVIKESVDVKTKAFVALFEQYGNEIMQRVKSHHEANGGMSRFIKLPIYLEWANEIATPERIDELSDQFSSLSFNGVIDAPWVPGAKSYLSNNPYDQEFVAVSATPEKEFIEILKKLDLINLFSSVFGSPASKKEAIAEILQERNLLPEQTLMIGDAMADYEAALANKVPFILRKHTSNMGSFANYTGLSVNNILEL